MKKILLSLLLFFGLTAASFATTDICDINIGPDNKAASYANGENVSVYIDYSTDEAAGVRIFARPYSNGNLTPNYGASGSALYTGSGTATSSFTIISGNALVDEIRIEVYASDNTTLLRRTWVPVKFYFGNAGVNTFTYSSSTVLSSFLLSENFTTSFNYNVSYPGGVRVFIRPMTNGSLTPGYGASGSGTYTGSGSISSNFTITTGKNVHVDALRVLVTSADQTVNVYEFFIPVNLYFSTVKVTDITPQAGNFPYNNEDRQMSFNYSTTEANGVRIFPRPWTNGALTPNYGASGSVVYTGSGGGTSTFTITSTNQRVDHVRFNVTSADQSETLLEMFYPVEYTFGNFLIEAIHLCPAAPARLENGAPVNINYSYYNDQGQDARIFVRPFTNGSLTPGYGASGSGLYPSGGNSTSAFFTITAGNAVVDQLRFQVTSGDQATQFAEYFIPVHYVFGAAVVPTITPTDMVESISISPNPSLNDANLSILLKEDQQVQVTVTDLSGKMVQQLGTRNVTAQIPEQWQMDANQLPNGAYVVLVQGAGFKAVRKWVVAN